MDCVCRGSIPLGHGKSCERYNALLSENGGNTVSKFEYDITRTITTTARYSKKNLLRIFADDNVWFPDGRFSKLHAIQMVRIEFEIGLKDAKELVEDFMGLVFGAKATPFNAQLD